MVLSSVEVCMDSADWPQSFMQNSALKLPEDLMSCSRPPPMLERRMKPQPEQALKCPRCDSTNTKFCYYNNYNLSQPRHFCKTCRRYWTQGGSLRNVPVGGGCRKNKRVKRSIDHPTPSQNEASTSAAPATTEPPVPNCSAFDASLPLPPSSMYYGGNSMNMTSLPFTRIQQECPALANCNTSNFLGISCGTPTTLEPQSSSLNSLSALNPFNSFKSNYPGLEFSSLTRDRIQTIKRLEKGTAHYAPQDPVQNSTSQARISRPVKSPSVNLQESKFNQAAAASADRGEISAATPDLFQDRKKKKPTDSPAKIATKTPTLYDITANMRI